MSLYLSEADIEALVTMTAVIDRVEAVAAAQAAGRAWQLPRERLRMPKGVMLHTMSAAWPEAGYFAHKAYASVGGDVRFRVYLYDARDGRIVAVMQGNRLGQLRTGAATAVAAKRLLPAEPGDWALFGTGLQAWGQIEALTTVAKPKQLRVYSRNAEHRRTFAARAAAAFDIDAVAVESPSACARNANVIITATTARDPVVDGSDIARGAFIAAVGANMRIKRELDGAALKAIDRIIVDDRATAERESGLLLTPLEAGFMRLSDIAELPELVVGRASPRRNDEETLCFHSLGSAAWDLAAAIVAFEAAQAAGIGMEIPLD